MKNCFEPTTHPKRHKTYKKERKYTNIRGFVCLAFPSTMEDHLRIFFVEKNHTLGSYVCCKIGFKAPSQ